jgi:hypothetical protein
MSKLLISLNKSPAANCLENSYRADKHPTPLIFLASSTAISKRGGHPSTLAPSAPDTEAKRHFENGMAET